MIADVAELRKVRLEWRFVLESRDRVARNLASGASSGIGVSHEFRDFSYCLCLLFACSVLEHVLLQLRDEGVFKSKSTMLGPMMAESKGILPWHDYGAVDRARECRNSIAHERKIPERKETWRYIDAVETQLNAWKIL